MHGRGSRMPVRSPRGGSVLLLLGGLASGTSKVGGGIGSTAAAHQRAIERLRQPNQPPCPCCRIWKGCNTVTMADTTFLFTSGKWWGLLHRRAGRGPARRAALPLSGLRRVMSDAPAMAACELLQRRRRRRGAVAGTAPPSCVPGCRRDADGPALPPPTLPPCRVGQ